MTTNELLSLGNFAWLNRVNMFKTGYGGTYITLDEIINLGFYNNGYIDFNDIYSDYWLEYEDSVTGAFRYTLNFDNLPVEIVNLSFEDVSLINDISVSLVDYNGNSIANVSISESHYNEITLENIEEDYPNDISYDNLFINSITAFYTTPYSSTNDLFVLNRFDYQTAYYNIGYNEGYNTASSQAQTQIQNSYNEGYQVGYNTGYQVGYDEDVEVNLASPVLAVADAPLTIFKNIFDVDILGFNLASACFGICGLMLVIWLIKKFFGGGE